MKNLLTLLLICSSFLAHGQWIKEKGTGYLKLGGWSLLANKHFTDQGLTDPNSTQGLFINSIYGEIGIGKKINIIAYLPFFVKNYQYAQVSKTTGKVYEPRQEYNGLGDFNLGLEYGWGQLKNWKLSGSLILGIPSGESTAGSDGSYQTGDGEFNQLLQINLGKSYRINNQSFYLKSYLGYNNRTQGFSDEFHWFGETGTQLFNSNLLILSRLHWIKPLYNGTLDASNANGAIFANNIESFTLGGRIGLEYRRKMGNRSWNSYSTIWKSDL